MIPKTRHLIIKFWTKFPLISLFKSTDEHKKILDSLGWRDLSLDLEEEKDHSTSEDHLYDLKTQNKFSLHNEMVEKQT